MHVIDRRANQSVMINGCIEVKVLEVKDTTVRLSIVSPDEIPPYREITIDMTRETDLQEVLSF